MQEGNNMTNGLRRRARAVGGLPRAGVLANDRSRRARSRSHPQRTGWKFSRSYCRISALAAILAIITAPSGKSSNLGVAEQPEQLDLHHDDNNYTNFWDNLFGKAKEENHEKLPPPWLRWLIHPKPEEKVETKWWWWLPDCRWCFSWIDPVVLRPDGTTATDLIDKVLTSTVRLLLIANWLLALTVLLHTAVADWFLGAGNNTNGSRADAAAATTTTTTPRTPPAIPPVAVESWTSSTPGRERLGGFLVFKLLLISAVVAPDTLDLLILLSWYTVLSFLRSLAALCAQQTVSARTAGHTPAPGVWKLLVTVLCSDLTAATVCVALFHGAGTGMVLLLTCDCALLAVDVITHILQHLQLLWEIQHAEKIGELEEEQLRLHRDDRQVEREGDNEYPLMYASFVGTTTENASRQLDRQMEMLEQQHMRKTSVLETAVFSLKLLTDLITVAHFAHIWSLHGVQFTLIDGVLALHLHSAMSHAAKKIAERRNMYYISRDMDGRFEDATELDLRKAAESGDVCCICLGTMSYFHSTSNSQNNVNVKKLGCGHLYHTNCLREVVERARSMDAARCPLCRSSVVNGREERSNNNRGENNHVAAAGRRTNGDRGNENDGNAFLARDANDENREGRNDETVAGAGEHALFRFSTDNILPAWIPLPSFSFEVVRRPPGAGAPARGAGNTNRDGDANNAINIGNSATGVDDNNANNNAGVAALRQQNRQRSFLRRMLLMAGAIPMSPAEENAALEQLTEMFPQYDRSDILRALRERGSAESVAESILLGAFVGMPRGVDMR